MSKLLKVGKFEVELGDIIGHGEFGVTYLAINLNSKKKVAAKKLKSNDDMDASVEMKMHDKLDHINIRKMYDYSLVNDGLWVFYEIPMSSKGDLNKYFRRKIRPLETKLYIAAQVVSVVAYLHRQDPPIFHRSIKPSYLIPFDDTDSPLVKLSGFARALSYQSPIKTPELKPDEYKAPECHTKDGEWHLLSDEFSIGMIMLAMIQHPDTDTSRGLYPLSVESIKCGIRDMPIGIEMVKADKKGEQQPQVVEIKPGDSEEEKTIKQMIKDLTVFTPSKRKTASQCLPTFKKKNEKQHVAAQEGHQQK